MFVPLKWLEHAELEKSFGNEKRGHRMKTLAGVCSLFLIIFGSLRAGEPAPSAPPPTTETADFAKGTHEFEALVGFFASADETIPGPVGRPTLTTLLTTLRYGWMLNDQRSGMFSGNEEFLLEVFGGPVQHGPGTYLAGGTMILRHNFVWGRRPMVVPYVQIGAGLVGSDASQDRSQFSIGTPVSFNLQSSLGARWRLSQSWSINTEFNYRHISNAGLSDRNGGYDLLGGFVGFGRMF
jgi:opacity protein-like surface antigen